MYNSQFLGASTELCQRCFLPAKRLLGDKPERHFFNKLFTPFLAVVIDIGTKHNLLFPIGYRKVCYASAFAM